LCSTLHSTTYCSLFALKDASPTEIYTLSLHDALPILGRIGEAVARRAKGFGMNILYHNRTRKFEAEDELNVVYASFDELIKRSRSEEHTSELQSRFDLVCRLLLEKKKRTPIKTGQREG